MEKRNVVLISVILGFTILQFIRPDFKESEISKAPLKLEGVPTAVNDILENSCFSCHSSNPDLSWYDRITPVNFLVNSHIQKARAVLDFSKWDRLNDKMRKGKLYYSLNKIMAGEMPLPSYAMVHPGARVSKQQIEIIKNYLRGITSRPLLGTTSTVRQEVDRPLEVKSLKTLDTINLGRKDQVQGKKDLYNWVEKSPNGIAYIPDYRNWKVVSTTDRFDNGTIRIIFANQNAITAIAQKKTNPWPDGSILAKVLWKQKQTQEGQITTGEFIHVEYMIKDQEKYASTQGWGWARWKGQELEPFGETANFVQDCIRCHSPVKDNDNVFTIPLNIVELQKPLL